LAQAIAAFVMYFTILFQWIIKQYVEIWREYCYKKPQPEIPNFFKL